MTAAYDKMELNDSRIFLVVDLKEAKDVPVSF